ncbi:MAG: hypothetical protein J2P58_12710, partial [Acidimicrobiaceae bacterium]|nr:hypothetical protein [Acidimicrobiaceae bacterium]
QEPLGDENTQQVVRERAGSWSAEETGEVLEAAPQIVRSSGVATDGEVGSGKGSRRTARAPRRPRQPKPKGAPAVR